MMEPGRFLVGSAGVLLTEVLYRKHSGGREFVIVDAGNERPAAAEPLQGVPRNRRGRCRPGGRPSTVDVVGPVCETGDFLALERALPGGRAAGERLAVLGAGAYGFVMSSNYNTPGPRRRGPGGRRRWAVVRPREAVDEPLRRRAADPFATLSDNG